TSLSNFFYKTTAKPHIYTLSLHDALPISINDRGDGWVGRLLGFQRKQEPACQHGGDAARDRCSPRVEHTSSRESYAPDLEHSTRSEEHTSELQSRFDLVCRLLLEKKKMIT